MQCDDVQPQWISKPGFLGLDARYARESKERQCPSLLRIFGIGIRSVCSQAAKITDDSNVSFSYPINAEIELGRWG